METENKVINYLERYADSIEATIELTNEIKCPKCSKKLKDILQKYGVRDHTFVTLPKDVETIDNNQQRFI